MLDYPSDLCMICGRGLARGPLCWCGFDNKTRTEKTITANEEFIFSNTRTSHKRYESMVVYALHYVLRDLELLSQFHVRTRGQDYFIDLYAPALKIAIEIDEPHHDSVEQKQWDLDREDNIKEVLCCEFMRVNCRKSIYGQIDQLVSSIKARGYNPWTHVRPNYTERSGEYALAHWEALEVSGIIPIVEQLKAKLIREWNFDVSDGAINGIPSAANGEYGFIVNSQKSPHTLAVFARKTGLFHVRVVQTRNFSETLLESSQLSKRTGVPRYFKVIRLKNGSTDISIILNVIVELLT